ncbi:hypothetical protein RHMOL_Rhmol05G0167600 [Rhododendron molle]|uniref:Uncharacterized protein n=1 Tax=Rhododendron molle TaxID=49168 RepID=A0ACC0NS22_RHOML|nr:hypothetical protein RHMOL_Rhmol05G0167600 [Rhododendron molle]
MATQNTAAVIVALPKKKTRRSNKNAAAQMSELPNDIMPDILSRLPLNSLFRCKRVCKVWQNIILEPYFAELHHSIFYRYGYKRPMTISYFDIEEEQYGSFPLPSHLGDRRNGLVAVDNQLVVHSQHGSVCVLKVGRPN